MNPFALRDELADAMEAVPIERVYREPPDALVPPCVVVSWESSLPGDLPGTMSHRLGVEIWSTSDLASTPHYFDRDGFVLDALTAIRKWIPDGAGVTSWEATNETRQLGQQTTRVAVVAVSVIEPDLCP